MLRYIIKRLIQGIIVLLILSILIFVVVRFLPGDPMLMYASRGSLAKLTPEAVEAARHEWGLDLPIWQQYINWIGGIFHGDFGKSIFFNTEVSRLIGERLPVTLYFGIIAFILSSILGILVGIVSALRRGRWQDYLVTILANIGICLPAFWISILLMYVFGYKLGWLPISGFTSPFEDLGKSLSQTILPLVVLMIFDIAGDARQTRSSVLEVMSQDYIRTAWAKGLNERQVVRRHILKNALIPVVSFKGMGFAYIVGGSVFVEEVFCINGIGRLATQAVMQQDYAVIQAVVLLTGIAVVLANLIVDILYGVLDPRIRDAEVM